MVTMNLMLVAIALHAEPMTGEHKRTIVVDGRKRSFLLYVPPRIERDSPAPLVLALHGAGVNSRFTAATTGLNEKADEAGFVVAYPDGAGIGPVRRWNAGVWTGNGAANQPDDVKFIACLLDDVAAMVNIDEKRVFAAGMSNGGMMCYRLAAELSDRIAAIAPVAGAMGIENVRPSRHVPVIHFHGAEDKIVPLNGPGPGTPKFVRFLSVDETIAFWRQHNDCPETPAEATAVTTEKGTTYKRTLYRSESSSAEVVLYVIERAGHVWPGRKPPVRFIGRSPLDVSANDLMWDFFRRHPLP